MKLKDFLEANWKAAKLCFSIGDNHIPGAIYYRMTEMNIDDFVPLTYISKTLQTHENFKAFTKVETRHNINKTMKKFFGNDTFVEHIVPKKFVLQYWNECTSIAAFEKYLRAPSSICFLTREENALLPTYKGRETIECALKKYKECKIDIKPFRFTNEK